jgi:phage baseplate assembly protein W
MSEENKRLTIVRSPYSVVDAKEKGIGFPFFRGQEGMFSRRYGLDVIVDDILSLIHINKGEYPNDPELGVGIKYYLFELIDENIALDIESEIEKQVLKYIKNIVLVGVDVKVNLELALIDLTVRFKKVNGSRDIIRFNNKISTDQNTLEVGVEAS